MLAGAAVMTLAGAAQAGIMTSFSFDQSDFLSSENPSVVLFSGTWTYTPGTTGTLELVLTNSTANGFITAIAFNTPDGSGSGDVNLGAWSIPALTSEYDEFFGFNGSEIPFANDGSISGHGFLGDFNQVYSVDGDQFGGAGGMQEGIEPGEIATFTWTVIDKDDGDASNFSVLDFLNPELNDGKPYFMGVRFKELGDDGEGSEQLVLIPLPAALPMGLAGLAGLALVRHRSRSARGKKPATA